MPSLPAILLGALLADGSCAYHDSEDNVCLLALNSSRSTLEANASLTAAVPDGLSNTTDLSLAMGNTSKGFGATLGTLVSDYVRGARSASNRSAGVVAGGALVQSSENSSANAAADQHPETETHHATETHDATETHHATEPAPEPAPEPATEPASTNSAMELAPEFQQRIAASAARSAAEKNRDAHFTGKTPPQSPGESFSLNTDALPFGKTTSSTFTGKGTVKNPVADQMNMAKKINEFGQSGVSTTFGKGAPELKTVLQSMYDLGRLIQRMPDDRLETRMETPPPTPPPYAFARRFVNFGKGTSAI